MFISTLRDSQGQSISDEKKLKTFNLDLIGAALVARNELSYSDKINHDISRMVAS